MTEGYYCPKCKKFVLHAKARFMHPHEGIRFCYACTKCWEMVYLKEQEELNEKGATK